MRLRVTFNLEIDNSVSLATANSALEAIEYDAWQLLNKEEDFSDMKMSPFVAQLMIER